MPEPTNAAWIDALSAPEGPDPEALADLRARLRRAALFSIRRRLGTAHGVMSDEIDSLAEDCAQEALLIALQNLGSFRGEARFVTWASAIAVGVGMATTRRRLWRDLSLDHMPDGWQEPAASATSSSGWEHPHLAAQRAEIWSVIREVVQRDLTDRQRRVLNLVVIHGVDADEVAERLGIEAAEHLVAVGARGDDLRAVLPDLALHLDHCPDCREWYETLVALSHENATN